MDIPAKYSTQIINHPDIDIVATIIRVPPDSVEADAAYLWLVGLAGGNIPGSVLRFRTAYEISYDDFIRCLTSVMIIARELMGVD